MRINKSFIALTSSDASVAWSNITGTPTTLSGYGITDGVPTSRTLTINGVTYDLSANRIWTVSDTNIYTTDGTLTGLRNVTLSGYNLTFTGSATTTVVHSSGRLLLGGATDNSSFVLNATGSANISTNLNVGTRIDATTIIASINVQGFLVRATSYFSLGLIGSISAPSVGSGFIFAKSSDKKLYWINSDGTEYDLTTGSGGTVTSVALATGTSGTDVNITGSPITSSGTITLNIPDASASARGLVTTGSQTFNGSKTFDSSVTLSGVSSVGLKINRASNSAGFLAIQSGVSSFFNAGSGYVSISSSYAQSLTVNFGGALKTAYIQGDFLTSSQTYYLPDASGTIALTSSLSGYVPTTRTLTINDTAYDLSANRSWSIGDYGTW